MTDRQGGKESRENQRLAWYLWQGPGLIFVALIIFGAISFGTAYIHLGTGNIAVNLLIAAIMVGLLVTFLMDLRNATALVRVVAAAGLFWLIFMFALTFSDYLSRYY